jgi:hypothetical protein
MAEPTRTKLRNDKDEPRVTKSNTESWEPILPMPMREKAEPNRAKLRTDNEAPRCKKSSTDREAPRRDMERIDRDEPTCT